MKKPKTRPVRIYRKFYPNCFALTETVSMLTALGYIVKIV